MLFRSISLSVLDHLGRNLYRSFITVIGEAISNSWDADAENVWITIDRDNNNFIIKDDGIGMSKNDFQTKFLKIGYTKRKDGISKSEKGRPFIGRKGIGKLALLSCAEKISVMSKTKTTDYIGGVIDNSSLDDAINNDITAQEYVLEKIDNNVFSEHIAGHCQGTIIYFENINDGIKNKLEYIRTLIALYFRFSLVDSTFNIFVNNIKITETELKSLADKSEFLWKLNKLEDPYVPTLMNLKEQIVINSSLPVKGFISSVEKPRHLKIRTADEKVGIDLFVNGRLRERNILTTHMPDFATRHIASYLYGQIHFDRLDDGSGYDRFTTSREGVKEGDPEYKKLLNELKNILEDISKQWDEWRLEHRKDGDPENPRITPKERKARSLVNEVSNEFTPPKGAPNKNQIDKWINELGDDAQFNVSAYIDCFMSENLIRNHIEYKAISLTPKEDTEINVWKGREQRAKNIGNISIDITENGNDLNYLSMDYLANLVDNGRGNHTKSALTRDATEYKPMRNAVAHTARLTVPAKSKLTSVYENIKGRLKKLLSQ